jgi:hypothetical protein
VTIAWRASEVWGLGRAGNGCGAAGMAGWGARRGREIGGGRVRAAPWIQAWTALVTTAGMGLARLGREISEGEGRTRVEAVTRGGEDEGGRGPLVGTPPPRVATRVG